MAAAGISTVGSKVTILGLTFKEDCPDLRNSKVPDIIRELRQYGCDIQVHDSWCDPIEAAEEYGLELTPQEKLHQASAIILAVAHKSYRDWTPEEWRQLLLPSGVIADVKNIVPARAMEQAGYLVWRL